MAGTVVVTDPAAQTTYDAFGYDYQARRFFALYEIYGIMAAYDAAFSLGDVKLRDLKIDTKSGLHVTAAFGREG